MLVHVFPMEQEGSEATGRVLRSDLYFHGLQPGRCVTQHLYRVDSGGELFVWRCCQTHCPLGGLKIRSMPMDHAYTFAQRLLPWPCESPCRGTTTCGCESWGAWLPAHSPAITGLGQFPSDVLVLLSDPRSSWSGMFPPAHIVLDPEYLRCGRNTNSVKERCYRGHFFCCCVI